MERQKMTIARAATVVAGLRERPPIDWIVEPSGDHGD
jgi:hypothetical protein